MLNLAGQRAVLFLGIIWIGLEFFILGPFSAITAGDNADVIIPDLMSFAFTDDGFALWNRFSTAGTDRRSMGSLSPADIWLFNHLPAWLAYQLRVLSQIILAAIATAVICRKWVGMETMGALFAGLSYALIVGSGGRVYMSALAYLPVLLLTIGLVLENKQSALRWLALILATTLFGLSAHLGFLFPFPQALIGIWFLVVDRRTSIADWVIIVTAPTLATLIRLPDYLAMATNASFSQRHVTGETYSIDAIGRAAQGGWQILFGTPEKVVVTVLAISACVLLWRQRMTRRLIAAAALIAGMVFGVAASQDLIFELFPFAQGFNLNRLWTVFSLLAVMLAGLGVQGLATALPGGRSRDRVVLGVALAALLLSSLHYKYYNIKDWVSQGNMVQNFSSDQLSNLARRIRADPLPARVAAYQTYPNYLHAYGMETAGGYLSMVAKRYFDFWSGVLAPSLRDGNMQDIARMFVQNGNRLMLSSDDKASSVRLADYFNLNLLSLANVKYFVSRDPLTDPQLTLLEAGERPWNSRSLTEKVMASARANFTGRKNLYVYRNENALERFFIAPTVRSFDTAAPLLKSLGDASPDELRRTAFIVRGDLPEGAREQLQGLAAGTVSPSHYDSDRIELAINTTGPALLVMTNSYNTEWRAEADGVEIPVFPVDHAFMGVLVQNGTRNVVFRYGGGTY